MNQKSKGFTLIELMIVVAIMGILGLIGGVSIVKVLPAYQLQKAAREMVINLRQARSMAIKLNRRVPVNFYVSGNYYKIDNNIVAGPNLGAYYGSGLKFGTPAPSPASPDSSARSSGECVHFTVGLASGPDADDTIVFNTRGLTEKLDGTASVMGYVYIMNNIRQGYRIGVTGLAANIKMDQCGGSVDCTLNP